LLCSSLGTAGVSGHRLIRVIWPRHGSVVSQPVMSLLDPA
jgi:hypothetical protein